MTAEQVETAGGFALLALSCGIAAWTGSVGLGIAAVFTAVAIIGFVIRATKKAPAEPLE